MGYTYFLTLRREDEGGCVTRQGNGLKKHSSLISSQYFEYFDTILDDGVRGDTYSMFVKPILGILSK